MLGKIKEAKIIDDLEYILFYEYKTTIDFQLNQNINHILNYKSFYNLITPSMIDSSSDDNINKFFDRINLELKGLSTNPLHQIDYLFKRPSVTSVLNAFYLIVGVCPRWKSNDNIL